MDKEQVTLERAYVGQDIANLRFCLYNRRLEPHLFHIFERQSIERTSYRADFWIIGSSHVVNLQTQRTCVAEVISGDDRALPKNGRIELIRDFENRQCDFHLADDLNYSAKLDVLNDPGEDFVLNGPTPNNGDRLFRLQHRFPTRKGIEETPVTVIDVLRADENQIELKTFHSYVEAPALVVTHSVIQIIGNIKT